MRSAMSQPLRPPHTRKQPALMNWPLVGATIAGCLVALVALLVAVSRDGHKSPAPDTRHIREKPPHHSPPALAPLIPEEGPAAPRIGQPPARPKPRDAPHRPPA